jgi:hypothetical protein
MQPFSCQHRKQHISKWNYEITGAKEIHISRLELQRWSLEFVISFSKSIYLGFGIDVWLISFEIIQISIKQMNFHFSVYIFQTMKVKIFCGKIYSTSYNQILTSKE